MFNPKYKQKKENIIFAICVHSTECWLLPLVYTDKRKEHTINCLNALNNAIKKKYKGIAVLTEKNKNEYNGKNIYDKIMSEWKRKSDIENTAQHNIGFKKFISSLNTIRVNDITEIK